MAKKYFSNEYILISKEESCWYERYISIIIFCFAVVTFRYFTILLIVYVSYRVGTHFLSTWDILTLTVTIKSKEIFSNCLPLVENFSLHILIIMSVSSLKILFWINELVYFFSVTCPVTFRDTSLLSLRLEKLKKGTCRYLIII